MRHLPKLPKRFRIEDDEVVVLFVPQKTLRDENGFICEGMYYSGPSPKQIKIAKHLSRARKWKIFLHEMIHVIEEEETILLDDDVLDDVARGFLKLFIANGWKLPGE